MHLAEIPTHLSVHFQHRTNLSINTDTCGGGISDIVFPECPDAPQFQRDSCTAVEYNRLQDCNGLSDIIGRVFFCLKATVPSP